jgi:hypothetical protein
LLRGPFEPATHDISIFRGGKKDVPKKVGIELPFILRLKRVIKLLEIVDMLVNQTRLLCGEMSTLVNTKNSCQECVVVRRPFLKGSRTGEFSSTVLLMEGALKIEWKCIRWLSKRLL